MPTTAQSMKNAKQSSSPTNNEQQKKKKANNIKIQAPSQLHDDQLSIVLTLSTGPNPLVQILVAQRYRHPHSFPMTNVHCLDTFYWSKSLQLFMHQVISSSRYSFGLCSH